jgi:hypothetical protein
VAVAQGVGRAIGDFDQLLGILRSVIAPPRC